MQDATREAQRLFRDLAPPGRRQARQYLDIQQRPPTRFERALSALAASRAVLLSATFVNVFLGLSLAFIYPDPHAAALLLTFLIYPPVLAALLFILLGSASGRFRRIPVERAPNILVIYTAFLLLFITGAFFSTPPAPIAVISLSAYLALVFLSGFMAVWMGYAFFKPRSFARWMV